MGCDIHFFTERYSSDDYDGPKDISEERDSKLEKVLTELEREPRWITADKWVKEDGRWTIDYDNRFYSGRNYYLFTVLAGVRGNGPTILRPKGVPEDASYAYKMQLDSWGGDAHSASYFTLEELLNTNWSKYKKDDWLDDFMETIEKMKQIDSDPSKVRCCFFFDN